MKLREVAFAVGQRFCQVSPNAPDRYWRIGKVAVPETMEQQTILELRAERDGATLRRSEPALAYDVYVGAMRPDTDEKVDTKKADTKKSGATAARPSIALGDLVAEMTPTALRNFKMRTAYVEAARAAENVGLSWKDAGFRQLITDTFNARQEAWLARIKANPGDKHESIEGHEPSIHSVYRWSLAVRHGLGDLSVLAGGELAIQTRKPRKSAEQRLLAAWLPAERAQPVKHTATSLAEGFNRHAKRVGKDPLRLDEEIERLRKKAQATLEANRSRRRRGTLTKPKAKPKSDTPVAA